MVTKLHQVSDRKPDAKKKKKEKKKKKRGEICKRILIISSGNLPFLVDVNLNTYAYALLWNIRYDVDVRDNWWTLETIDFTVYLLILSLLASL